MKFGVVVFPGSNCDHDAYHVLKHVLGARVEYIWHKDTTLRLFDVIVLPGGFSYGDYLRAGAVARFAPIMPEIMHFAEKGGKVIGICNGFQILMEAGLLPGALIPNDHMRFRCQEVYLKVTNNATAFTRVYDAGQVIKMPIAHYCGQYFAEDDILKQLQDQERIAFQYCDSKGEINAAANPNGSKLNIAGILNEEKNVLGMMPHPERAAESILDSEDGLGIFKSLLGSD
ncbi:MAG: phosphoribosylformylglycinamidine synthase subunit PurQ [Candidatus Marinimicrobia bacterium]|nr:phosphoribosylformylglycinamidine synthase subunit PurQ [Candidatus Neomarinimicrobiota bacterium]MCK9559110.1 phosphoribosylformylglycinamidine synthase subunit PurQ [Candidatus Neomarinimicrobiota bacterium]MDD5060813.1 phosphoribosylformylglycinamidine synthase subunit PurQ [Candidatus Neomarinimicrobiota bacterium]MDD5229889.1 phosphoribosylformylglycinamidine synthase subunit PurQ [Candidatus Neomarinimicrobiota bacterium]MDD5540349.1 phosphoribosylformylglycinamidine synthase subunit P